MKICSLVKIHIDACMIKTEQKNLDKEMEEHMKKIVSYTLVFVMILGLMAGCSGGSSSTATSTASSEASRVDETSAESPEGADGEVNVTGRKIGFLTSVLQWQFWLDLAEGAQNSIRPGDEIIILSHNDDMERFTKCFEDLLAQDCDIICSVVTDEDVIRPYFEMAKEAGVELIVFEGYLSDKYKDLCYANITSDDYGCGYECGKYLAENLPDGSEVISLCWDRNNLGQTRLKGFKEGLALNSTLKLVANTDCETDPETCLSAIESMLVANPDAKGFWSFTANGAFAAITAFTNAGYKMEDVLITTVDATDDLREEIEKGNLDGAIDQLAYDIGATTIEYAYKCLDGEPGPAEKHVGVPIKLVTVDNLSDYD